MQTYWDLSERERAALTYDDVKRFVDAELMLKGVLAAGALELVPVPDAPVPSVTLYRPRIQGRYAPVDVAFTTEEKARAFLDLDPAMIEKDWQLGDAEIATPVREASVEAVTFVMRATADAYKSQLQSIKAAKDENDRRRRAHEEQQKKVDQALQGLWDDWHACCAKGRAIAAINATREKYLRLADGDETTARRFILLVHTEDELAEAAAWGDAAPGPTHGTPSAVVVTNNSNEIPF